MKKLCVLLAAAAAFVMLTGCAMEGMEKPSVVVNLKSEVVGVDKTKADSSGIHPKMRQAIYYAVDFNGGTSDGSRKLCVTNYFDENSKVVEDKVEITALNRRKDMPGNNLVIYYATVDCGDINGQWSVPNAVQLMAMPGVKKIVFTEFDEKKPVNITFSGDLNFRGYSLSEIKNATSGRMEYMQDETKADAAAITVTLSQD